MRYVGDCGRWYGNGEGNMHHARKHSFIIKKPHGMETIRSAHGEATIGREVHTSLDEPFERGLLTTYPYPAPSMTVLEFWMLKAVW